jgi:tungstate transport system substrate-binding protein
VHFMIRSLRFIAAITVSLATQAVAQDKSIVVASTTSTQDSGLFGYLLPIFKEKTGIDVKVVARGTGQALDTARRGDANVVLVHAKTAEEKFLSEGFGVKRHPVMYNDFVLIGPQGDPAGIKGKDIVSALKPSRRSRRPSFRVAIALERISPRSNFGRTQGSTSRGITARGTRKSVKGCAQR